MVIDILNVNLTLINIMDALIILLVFMFLILFIYIVLIVYKLNRLQKSIDELRYVVNKLLNRN